MILNQSEIQQFHDSGYLIFKDLLTVEEITDYRELYERFLNNEIDAARYRSDLSGTEDSLAGKTERITQIMVPSRILPDLKNKNLHVKSLAIARELLGEDIDLDFDMLIDKAPHSDSPTPWHQDCAYWITMPDIRAVSCWVALDDAFIENGCMWYVPGSHKETVRVHRPSGKGGALQCDASESEGFPGEIKAGSCIFHHGGTLHYSRGNATDARRRAFITNFRPSAMIALERAHGFDHTQEREVRDEKAQK